MLRADEAVALIRSGQRIFVHGGAATPSELLEALAERVRAGELADLEVVHMHAEGPAPHLAPDLVGRVCHRALFVGPAARAAVREGRATYVPVFLSDIPALFRSGQLPLDVALLHLTPPDAHGFCSLGPSVDFARAAAEVAKVRIALINPLLPRTWGYSFVRYDDLDAAVPIARPPHAVTPEPVGEVERQIGAHVAELVENGATLQIGIGGVPNAVLEALVNHRDLGVHTEMFSDGVVDLVERGVITGAAKTYGPGKIVSAFVIGSERLYRFVHDNPMVDMRPVEYTNDTAIIRRHARMTAINSALEIDLTGQVCADSIGFEIYSGVGGQMDFMRGAALAPRGKPIIALPATARGGTVSRIAPLLRPGAGVVTSRAHVHWVVTEYGVANLHGKSLRERAAELAAIAHPAFRDELTAFAREHHYL